MRRRPLRLALPLLAVAVPALCAPAGCGDGDAGETVADGATGGADADADAGGGGGPDGGAADGYGWNPPSSDLHGQLSRVAYGAGVFVAVGIYGQPASAAPNTSWVLSSSDGKTWTERYRAPDGLLSGVAFGGGRWVAKGWDLWHAGARGSSETRLLLTSADAAAWARHTDPPGGRYGSLVWGGDRFLLVLEEGAGAYTSADGQVWQARQLPPGSGSAAAFGPPGFVVFGSGAQVARSVDGGSTWETATAPRPLRYVSWADTRFVACGWFHGDEGERVDVARLVSADGLDWQVEAEADAGGCFARLAAGNGVTVGVSALEPWVLTEAHLGEGFATTFDSPDQLLLGDLAWGGGVFVLVGQRRLRWSTAGASWSPPAEVPGW